VLFQQDNRIPRRKIVNQEDIPLVEPCRDVARPVRHLGRRQPDPVNRIESVGNTPSTQDNAGTCTNALDILT
jgi:hypothetical protein